MDKEEKEKGRRSKENRSDLGRRAPNRFLPSSASSPAAADAGRILSPLCCRSVSDAPCMIRPHPLALLSEARATLADHLGNDRLIDLVECKPGDRDVRRTMDKEEKEKGWRSKENRSDLGTRAPGHFLPSSASSPAAADAGCILSPLRCRSISDAPRKIQPCPLALLLKVRNPRRPPRQRSPH